MKSRGNFTREVVPNRLVLSNLNYHVFVPSPDTHFAISFLTTFGQKFLDSLSEGGSWVRIPEVIPGDKPFPIHLLTGG